MGDEDGRARADRSGRPWAAEEESAMVNSFDAGSSIAAVADLLQRPRLEVWERLHLFGRLPACDPVRAEEDRQLAATVDPPGIRFPRVPPQRKVSAPASPTRRRGWPERLLHRVLRTGGDN